MEVKYGHQTTRMELAVLLAFSIPVEYKSAPDSESKPPNSETNPA